MVTDRWYLVCLPWESLAENDAKDVLEWLDGSISDGFYRCLGQSIREDVHGLTFAFSDAGDAVIFMFRWSAV